MYVVFAAPDGMQVRNGRFRSSYGFELFDQQPLMPGRSETACFASSVRFGGSPAVQKDLGRHLRGRWLQRSLRRGDEFCIGQSLNSPRVSRSSFAAPSPSTLKDRDRSRHARRSGGLLSTFFFERLDFLRCSVARDLDHFDDHLRLAAGVPLSPGRRACRLRLPAMCSSSFSLASRHRRAHEAREIHARYCFA